MKGHDVMNRHYDLILSLGASCAAAHNLKIRRLRPFALPLDWTYIVDDQPLRWLEQAWSTRFGGFCEWENLREIVPGDPEYNEFHVGHRKYIDTLTGFRFINHFVDSKPPEEAYLEGKAKLQRRVERLFEAFESQNDFLLVFGARNVADVDRLVAVRDALSRVYPGKRFDLESVEFNGGRDEIVRPAANVTLRRFARDWNAYDTEGKNFEWAFMDELSSTLKPQKPPKASFHVLPHLKCIISFKRT